MAGRRAASGAALALGPVALALLSGCRSPDLNVQNLRALHGENGETLFVADLVDPVQWGFSFGESETPEGDHAPGEVIPDPYGETLENLLELAEFTPAVPRNAGMQVEMFAWLGVDDSYVLARERCVLELAEHAQRLGLASAEKRSPEAPVVRAAELGPALQALQEQLYPALVVHPSPGGPASLSSACEAVLRLDLDRAAGRRALAFCNIALGLQRREVAPEVLEACEPFYDLHIRLQQRLVSQALAEALDDAHPRVRAAAVSAVYALPATDRGQLLLRSLEDPAPEVGVAGLLAAAAHGLPSTAPPAAFGVRSWTEALIAVASGFDGRLSAAACRALAREAGGAHASLRAEDWAAWVADGGARTPRIP